MFARALLLLLVMLNLGVALWWMTRAEAPASEASVAAPAGIARLQLASEATRAVDLRSDRPAPDAPQPPVADAVPVERCITLGPFADAAAIARVRTGLEGNAIRMRTRESGSPARGWRVLLPSQPDRATANSMADRLRQAGFEDLYVVTEGDEANSIALGRFGGEAAANSHATRLRDAGFDVRSEALDGGAAQHWLDVALAEAASPDAVRRAAQAPRADAIDCARIP